MIVENKDILMSMFNKIRISDDLIELYRVDGSKVIVSIEEQRPNYLEETVDSINFVKNKSVLHTMDELSDVGVRHMDIVKLTDGSVFVFNVDSFVMLRKRFNLPVELNVLSWDNDEEYPRNKVVKLGDDFYKSIKANKSMKPNNNIKLWRKVTLYNMFYKECENTDDLFLGYIDVSLDSYMSESFTIKNSDDFKDFFDIPFETSLYNSVTTVVDRIALTSKRPTSDTIAFISNKVAYFDSVLTFKVDPYKLVDSVGSVFIVGYTDSLTNDDDVLFKVGITDVRPEYNIFNKVLQIKSDTSQTYFNVKNDNYLAELEVDTVEFEVDMSLCEGLQNIAIMFKYSTTELISSHVVYGIKIDKKVV